MKPIRTLALIASTTLLLTACNGGSEETSGTVSENTNPLLAYVPANTAYVMADLEAIPKEISDIYLSRSQPIMDVISKRVTQFQADYAAGIYQDNQMAGLAVAILDELGGILNSESLEKLGITIQADHAFYAMGVFPVARIGLSDAQALHDAIDRIEVKMGFELPVKTLNGTNYWHFGEDGKQLGLYVAILDQHLAISAFPVDAEDSLLAAFLGQKLPTQSMASANTLAIMNAEKGYTAYGTGYLDLQKLADELLNPNSITHTYLGSEFTELMSLDAVCVAEITSMIDKAPRMTIGTTRLSANEIAMRYELEINDSLASSLATLVSNTPAATDGDHLFSASLAVQVGKLRSFVLEKVSDIMASPYQCEMLQELNQTAGELVAQLNIPMPPMVNNLQGVRIKVDNLKLNGDVPQGEGLLALHVDKPEMFIGMASMMIPGFSDLDLPNQSEAVRVPAEVLQMEDLDVFAMMNDNAIGAALGEQHASDLAGFMAEKPNENGTFLSVSYDMARQFELQMALSQKLTPARDVEGSFADELSDAAHTSFTSIFDHSRIDMRFTNDGLVIDSNISFK